MGIARVLHLCPLTITGRCFLPMPNKIRLRPGANAASQGCRACPKDDTRPAEHQLFPFFQAFRSPVTPGSSSSFADAMALAASALKRVALSLPGVCLIASNRSYNSLKQGSSSSSVAVRLTDGVAIKLIPSMCYHLLCPRGNHHPVLSATIQGPHR